MLNSPQHRIRFYPGLNSGRLVRSFGLNVLLSVLSLARAMDSPPKTGFCGWSTNGPAVFQKITVVLTNAPDGKDESHSLLPITNRFFDHFLPDSLNNAIWTNFVAHTNGRNTLVWSVRSHPPAWPRTAPIVEWNPSGLMQGMKGVTALSPCWEMEGNPGQVPITALTRRHGYTRGHSMGQDGFHTDFAGKKVWFLSEKNDLVTVKVSREVVRTGALSGHDYTILLFDRDLPSSIQPMRVVSWTNFPARLPGIPGTPQPIFQTEQGGHVGTGIPGFIAQIRGGDSGSPEMLPLPGELVFFGGATTSGPCAEMQADMDELCRRQGLMNPREYQLRWVDLSVYPAYK